MPNNAASALTEEEFAELDDFLLSEACDEETLAVDEAHGFLTALIVAPDPIAQKQWLETVWGEPRFADEAEAERMTGLMSRLYQDIETTLTTRHNFEPLAVEVELEDEDEVTVAFEGWCYGFMLGVELNEGPWEDLPKDEQDLLVPIGKLALLNGDEEADMDDDEYQSWVELLPGAVMGLYSYMHEE